MRKKGITSTLIIVFVAIILLVSIAGLLFFNNKLKILNLNQSADRQNEVQVPGNNELDPEANNKITSIGRKFPEANPLLSRLILYKPEDDNLFFYNTSGEFITSCGQNNGVRASPDRTKLIYTPKSSKDIHLISDDCKVNKKLIEGTEGTNQYKPVGTGAIGWSPNSDKFLYGVISENSIDETREDNPQAKEGIYIYDINKNKSEQLITAKDKNRWRFMGWPLGFNGPLFTEGISDRVIYELDLNDKTIKPLKTPSFSFGSLNFTQSEITNEKFIVWADGQAGSYSWPTEDPNNYSQIMVSKLDRSREIPISPKGQWVEYQAPLLSPDGSFVIYGWGQENNGSILGKIMLYEFKTQKTRELPVLHEGVWINNNSFLYTEKDDVYKFNVNTGDNKLFAKGLRILDTYIYE